MKISIITVCFNSEKTIKDTLDSVLRQTYKPYEYIIIDGKSTDNTLPILNSYKKKFIAENIDYTIVSEKDKGLYDAMNKGISIAKGNVIGIINSDDWYENSTLEYVNNKFSEIQNIDILHANIRRVKQDGYTYLMESHNIENLKYYMCLNHPTFFVRKEIYQKYGCFSLKYKTAADYDFTLRTWLESCRFHKDDRIYVNMRLGGISDLEYKSGLIEKKEIQKSHHINPIIIECIYILFYIKHFIINILLKYNINYQSILKKKI